MLFDRAFVAWAFPKSVHEILIYAIDIFFNIKEKIKEKNKKKIMF